MEDSPKGLHALTKITLFGLVGVLVSMVIFKASSLELPLYWDEAWVYAPAVRAMFENGISLLPDTISTNLTRGHPLMFHFLGSAWLQVSGTSNHSLHLFALLLSICLLITTYVVGLTLGSHQLGLFATLIVALNETFLAQSSLFLPEVLLSLFILLTIFFFIKKRKVLFVIAGTCALLTKESAMVLMASLMFWLVVRSFLVRKKHSKTELQWMLLCTYPLLVASSFFVYQKFKFGWYFFPEHIGMMTWDVNEATHIIKFIYAELFELQGLEWITLFFGLVAPIIWRQLSFNRSLFAVLCLVTAVKVLFHRWPLPQPLTILVPLILMAVAGSLIIASFLKLDQRRGEFIAIGATFTIAYIAFCSVNFFTERYLMSLIPIVSIGTLAFIESSCESRNKLIFPALSVLFIAKMAFNIPKDDRVIDTRLSYIDAITVNQELIAYCETAGLRNEHINGSFMNKVYMTDPSAGYLASTVFTNVTDRFMSESDYIILDNSSAANELQYGRMKDFQLVRKFKRNHAWIKLYRRPDNIDH